MGQQSLNGRESRTRAGQCAVLEPGARLVSTGPTGKVARLLVPATPSPAGKFMPVRECTAGDPGSGRLALPRGRCQRRSPTSPRSVAGTPGPFHRAAVTWRPGAGSGWGPAPQWRRRWQPGRRPRACQWNRRCRVRSESAGPGHALATRKQSAQQHVPRGDGPAR
jgi:hypothetical protein